MKEGKVGVLLVLLVVVLGLGLSSASNVDQQRYKRKVVLPAEATSSSLVLNKAGSSIVLPVHGNVYPTGFYNVTLNIGKPSKPYFLDPDTGSDLTWLQCDVPGARLTKAPHPPYKPSNDLVACKDPLCESLPSPPDQRNCRRNPEQCDYQVDYADGSSSLGVLVRDAFSFNYTNGANIKPQMALGCGYDQVAGTPPHPSDGVLGLGKGKSSIVSQLNSQRLVRNVIGHCLSSRGGGFLFFGDDLYDSSRVVWSPMSQDKHYSPGFAELMFGGKATGIKNQGITFDSGSTYTYLNSQAYRAFASLLKKELSGTSLIEFEKDQTLPLCWKGRRPFRNVQDVKKYFKSFALSFTSGGRSKTQFELLPEDYLIISSMGNVCLGILDGDKAVQDYNIIIGDISMQDKMVIYDNEKQLIGWDVRANCDRIPKSKSFSFW